MQAFTVNAFDRLAEKASTPVLSAEARVAATTANDRAIDRAARCVGLTDRLRAALAAHARRVAGSANG